MSEQSPEPTPRASGGNALTRKLGPLPVWGWMGVGLAIALVYFYWKQHKANTATDSGTTSQSQVPEFVNQTFVTTTPPTQPPPQTPPPHERLRRNWTAVSTSSTLAQVEKRLGVVPGGLTPQNNIAKHWYDTTYKKNHNAKIPKGATFIYYEGTVSPPPPGGTLIQPPPGGTTFGPS